MPEVTQATHDKQPVAPLREALKGLPDTLGQIDSALMANGYSSAAHVHAGVQPRIEPLSARGREAHHRPWSNASAPTPPPPTVTIHWYRWRGG